MVNKLSLKNFFWGTLVWLIIISLGFVLILFPLEKLPTILVLLRALIAFIILLPFGVLVDSPLIFILPLTYLFIAFNFFYLLIKNKNNKLVNWIFTISTIIVALLYLFGLMILVAHP